MNAWLVVTPSHVDAILGAVALEFVLLGALLFRRGAGSLVGPLFLYLASGAALILALRASLVGAAVPWLALALLASLCVHALSLWQLYKLLLTGRGPITACAMPDPARSGS